jgi:hypothetical protein
MSPKVQTDSSWITESAEVLSEVLISIGVFWNVKLCRWVNLQMITLDGEGEAVLQECQGQLIQRLNIASQDLCYYN